MNRRSFLTWFGLGAAAVAAPALAKSAPVAENIADALQGPPFGYEIWDDGNGPQMRMIYAKDVYIPPEGVASHEMSTTELLPHRESPQILQPMDPEVAKAYSTMLAAEFECSRWWNGTRWTEQEEAEIRRAKMPPMVLNRIAE